MSFSLSGLGHEIKNRIFSIFGKVEFVQKLAEFWLHGGRLLRSETFIKTVKALKEIEEVKNVRIERLETIVEMMKAAGFTDEEIKEVILKEGRLEDISKALSTVLQYVERGEINIAICSDNKSIAKAEDEDLTKH